MSTSLAVLDFNAQQAISPPPDRTQDAVTGFSMLAHDVGII
jgi:hypothetical protein